ncbi:unnamed protein product [Rhizophagus irregularis]|nr:unnamed protein product [Rhizophagus irregularis]CAB4384853.1 unnamed protein product [Rhizophagus irregularis]CAB4384890.1 unnamed protein product [Rhizophagus irregularis]CAB4398524.1 unnamed protein product [Rhizophagus irregularis]
MKDGGKNKKSAITDILEYENRDVYFKINDLNVQWNKLNERNFLSFLRDTNKASSIDPTRLYYMYLDVWESGVNQISTKLMTPKEFVNGKVIVTADWTRPPEYRLETLDLEMIFRQGGGVFNNISRFSAFTGLFFSRLADKLNRWIDLPVDTIEDFWRSARAVPLANGITAQPIMANDRQKVEESRKTLRH